MFCEISLQVREQSPFQHTFFYGYTNGWVGYLPTKQGFAEGGYEPNTSAFTGETEQRLATAVSAFLKKWSK
jgi:hypothetical protein